MKVIFLDMDGVMNNAEWMKTLKTGEEANRIYSSGDQWWIDMIDPAAVALLDDLVNETGAKVVISSTWRGRHSPEKMQELLATRGFTGEVIGSTPHTARVLFEGEWRPPKMSMRVPRGCQIQAWLAENRLRVSSYVILDDDSDMEHLAYRHVKTHWQHWKGYPEGPLGLHEGAVEEAREILEMPFNPERDLYPV